MPRFRQRWFQWRLRRAGRRAPAEDLAALLEGGWRERLAATWLVAAGRRAELRPVIERGLLGDVPSGDRWSYCPALACLGTEDDARILVAYLDRALSLAPEEDGFAIQCQPEALATLMYLDQQLGTDHARRFLAADGPWERWLGSVNVSLAHYQDAVRADVVFAAGGDPGIRRMVKLQRR
ncbi:DUF6000 family protein [Kribbella sp. NBC_01484]|uniref:DUF6000 family protein n=1 Tax=Kribbella sp. NBC_01484 TaxID=2903579 RepID=UPI002E303911|nr:DUF6000 family protein [Kribbella sp. NBC_01484]